jgi:N-methylhydantoinase A
VSQLMCGVDIGGTFTDCVLIDEVGGRIGLGKALSSPGDGFRGGFFGSLEAAAEQLGLGLEEVLRRAGPMLNHGSTVATNIVVERSGARVGMLTTRGFEDTVRIMRGTGRPTGEPPENLLEMVKVRKPRPLVDRELVRGIDERVDAAATSW